ncbi:Phage holin protein [compost metagenome]
MGQEIWEAVQPLFSEIVKDLIGAGAVLLVVLYGMFKTKLFSYIKNEMLHKVASEAFAYAETQFKDAKGTAKMNQAFIYTSEKLGKIGIKVTPDEINAAIEKAVLEYNSKKKQAS